MIKYEIKLGNKAQNGKARSIRDSIFKPMLRGMNCRNPRCRGIDTVIEFVEEHYTPINVYIDRVIHPCCGDFEERIRTKLKWGR